ncbi:Basic leucine zipper (bZIP) transcription factor atfB [Colletotrichum orbiculare MAFF 240422]|uniref:Basic leucine zipper (BZIP) transcription factor atfB n=1 Tax=Colletotrichum orbiculare (strain 104-T / ATCC 96160 / CBS 514.97 / LARS 414 / MAFF 240422) TaxID=1213857 RepID=A0A484G3A2_COLOR|nr:Basic leucine zipper (bZIP) transcription factor atfB [Colletotrichum orbiculare MAFF 240422]
MDFGSTGVSTLQNEKTLQQHQQHSHHHQQQQQQRAQDILKQQLRLKGQATTKDGRPPVFVAPSALTSAPELAQPLTISERHSSTSSSQSSRGWQDSSTSNVQSSPASSVAATPIPGSVSPPVDPLLLSTAKDAKPQPTDANEPPKRRRGRPRLSESNNRPARGTTATTAAKTQQKKSAAARRASTASASGADDAGTGYGSTEEKKNRVRARNREAAYKCRQKKQKGIEVLQSQEAVAENINRNLTAEAAMLRGEILMLKNMVLQHGGCGCSYIEEYISGAAQNLVQAGMAASSPSSAPARAPGAQPGRIDMSAQPGTTTLEGGDGFVDWKMFDMDGEPPGMSAFGSESGFSGYDDASVAHSTRARSQGAVA